MDGYTKHMQMNQEINASILIIIYVYFVYVGHAILNFYSL